MMIEWRADSNRQVRHCQARSKGERRLTCLYALPIRLVAMVTWFPNPNCPCTMTCTSLRPLVAIIGAFRVMRAFGTGKTLFVRLPSADSGQVSDHVVSIV